MPNTPAPKRVAAANEGEQIDSRTVAAEVEAVREHDPELARAAVAADTGPAQPEQPWWNTGPARGLFIVVLCFALAFALKQTRELVLPIVGALLIAIVLMPIARALNRVRVPHAISAGIVVVLFTALVGSGIYALTDPFTSWIDRAPSIAREVRQKLRTITVPMAQAQQAARQVEELTNVGGQAATQEVTVRQEPLAQRVFANMRAGLIYIAETIVLVYFILAFGDAFVRKLVKIPASLRDKIHVVSVLQEIQLEVSHYLFTVACINAGLGAATALAVWLLGMPNPLLWGVMAALFNFVPYLGSAVTLSVLTVVSVLTYDTLAHALAVPAVFLGIATIEGQIVSPIVLGRRLSLSPLVIVIALMVGAWVWGVVGVLLAVPILVMMKIWFAHSRHLAPYAEVLGRD